MKKFLLLLLILAAIFSLTSCTVNWFGDQHYVPWVIGLVFILAIIIVTLLIMLKNYSSKYRTCNKCNHKFKPKWYHCFSAIFIGEKSNTECSARLFKCPHCKQKSLMPVSFGQKNEKGEDI